MQAGVTPFVAAGYLGITLPCGAGSNFDLGAITTCVAMAASFAFSSLACSRSRRAISATASGQRNA